MTSRYFDLDGAMHAVRSGEALAAVYIPQHLQRDIFGGRRPQTVIFYNKQFFTPGNIASSAIQSALSAAAATLPRGSMQTAYSPGPLTVEPYVLTNPALNYVQFLLRAIMPTVLHILIAIAGGYAVGSEFASRSLQQWMAAAGGNALTALVGKLAPYFGVFMIMMAVGIGVIHGMFRIPFRGDPIMMGERRLPAGDRLFVPRGLVSASGQEPCARPGSDRDRLLAGLRFRRGGLSHHFNGVVRPDMGRSPAFALVCPDFDRSSGAGCSCRQFRHAFHRARRAGGRVFWTGLVAAAGRRKRRRRRPGAGAASRNPRADKRRAGLCGGVSTRSRRPGGVWPDRDGADPLRRALSSTLCRALASQCSHRRRR